jgi:hypothetical protein
MGGGARHSERCSRGAGETDTVGGGGGVNPSACALSRRCVASLRPERVWGRVPASAALEALVARAAVGRAAGAVNAAQRLARMRLAQLRVVKGD